MESVREKLEAKVNIIDHDTGEIIELSERQGRPYPQNTDMVFSLEQAKERICVLQNFIKEMMVEGVDYGFLPNMDKRCLFKSGAEKLCDIFGFSKKIEIVNRVEDFEKGIFHYEVKAILLNKKNGIIEAEGVGSCNNMEKKYRSQDAYSIANTIIKMAKKRAFIDAVLSATRSSDLFTQDVEDDPIKAEKLEAQREAAALKSDQKNASEEASQKQISYIFTLLSEHKIPIEKARKTMISKYNVNESNLLSKNQASDFIEYLKSNHSQLQAG